ncbi:VacJ family lipoprotein [Sphingomonas sp.]|uniref:MlaA family lipoprotein n=1 Tax=Sphingomonas sp. TaxID=28214 RepID=UPI002EDA2938
MIALHAVMLIVGVQPPAAVPMVAGPAQWPILSTQPLAAVPSVPVPGIARNHPAIMLPPADAGQVPAGPAAPAGATGQGDVVVTAAQQPKTPGDPLEQVNAQSFAAMQAVDGAIVAPLSRAYKTVLPQPVRDGIRNALGNVREPIVFINFVLQLKVGKAAATFGRFAINSTIGVFGLFDFARRKPFKLPRRRNGFANTLGYYGVGSGPFLFLPGVGPTTLRDMVGGVADGLVLPVGVGKPFNQASYRIPVGVMTALNRRSEVDERLKQVRATTDPYAAARETYLNQREAEIEALHGRGPLVDVPASYAPPGTPAKGAPLPIDPKLLDDIRPSETPAPR